VGLGLWSGPEGGALNQPNTCLLELLLLLPLGLLVGPGLWIGPEGGVSHPSMGLLEVLLLLLLEVLAAPVNEAKSVAAAVAMATTATPGVVVATVSASIAVAVAMVLETLPGGSCSGTPGGTVFVGGHVNLVGLGVVLVVPGRLVEELVLVVLVLIGLLLVLVVLVLIGLLL